MDEVEYRKKWFEKSHAPHIFKAIEFSVKAHEGQFRKGVRLPYVCHPLAVGRILMDMGCPAEIVVAGILHDTVEDTEATFDGLKNEFGDDVARLVEAASEPEGMASWEERKNHTISRLEHVSEDELFVILADKFDNIHSIRLGIEKMGSRLWKSFGSLVRDQHWYYDSIAEVMERRIEDGPLLKLLSSFKNEIQLVFGSTDK